MTHWRMAANRLLGWFLLCVVAWFVGCPTDGAHAASSPSPSVPLFDNLGTLHHAITTTSEQAQRYFDQGLRLVYAFNHEEAISAFEEAARQDPGRSHGLLGHCPGAGSQHQYADE